MTGTHRHGTPSQDLPEVADHLGWPIEAASRPGGDGGQHEPGGFAAQIRARYQELLGAVTASIEQRLRIGELAGRTASAQVIEELRHALIMDNPLGPKVGELVQFGQLVALGRAEPARRHGRAAQQAGASLAELVAAVELALITPGLPAYGLGIEILAELAAEADAAAAPGHRDVAGPADVG